MDTIDSINALSASVQGKLAEALQSVIRSPVNLQLGHSGLVPLKEVKQMIGGASATSIYIPLLGDLNGDIFLFIDGLGASVLADLMIGNEAGTTSVVGDFEVSALKELGNITTGVIVAELANQLGLSLMLTVPNIATDFAGAVIDEVLITYAATHTEALAIHMPFTLEGHIVSGFFLLLFDQTGFEVIIQKLHGGNHG